MNGTYEAIFVLIVLLIFSAISFKKKLLDRDGTIIANIMGLAIYLLGGVSSFLTMVLFFTVAELATKAGRSAMGSKHEKRTIGNIIGNGAPALIALALGSNIAFYGAIAAALSDTLSSEIGLLSKTKPRLITNLKEVEPGTDGGVTVLGFLAGLIGAFFIAAIGAFIYKDIFIVIIITISGFIGCIIDSILGATFEIKGMLNNTQVNFLGSASGALIAHVLTILL
ncbi:MAG: DUF92 domain-containing protein [Candidatus Diapherotrites archaeon]|nr:DUF92 domain-containing protein [Candidatus Diapherotrites archaeon]